MSITRKRESTRKIRDTKRRDTKRMKQIKNTRKIGERHV